MSIQERIDGLARFENVKVWSRVEGDTLVIGASHKLAEEARVEHAVPVGDDVAAEAALDDIEANAAGWNDWSEKQIASAQPRHGRVR